MQAVSLAREHKNDVVILAKVISAETQESHHSAQGASVFGQSLGGSSHSAKATVELQGDLYSSVTGKKLDSIRATGEEHVTKVSGKCGYFSRKLGDDGQAPDSPLGKALQKAIRALALRVSGDEPKMIRYQPPADGAPYETKPEQ